MNIENDTDNFHIMLDEAYKLLDNDIIIPSQLTLPKLNLETTPTRIHWKNIIEYSTILNTNIDHLYDFITKEICSYNINWYSNNKEDGIIIHGKKIKNLPITTLLKKYINLYITCESCKNHIVDIQKINMKMYLYKCLTCGVTKNFVKKK